MNRKGSVGIPLTSLMSPYFCGSIKVPQFSNLINSPPLSKLIGESLTLSKLDWNMTENIFYFYFIFVVHSGCNQTVTVDDTVSILDLTDVKTSTACIWNLQSLTNTTIVVKVNDVVVLEGHLDRVTALDGENETSRVIQQCGSECSKLSGNIFLNFF